MGVPGKEATLLSAQGRVLQPWSEGDVAHGGRREGGREGSDGCHLRGRGQDSVDAVEEVLSPQPYLVLLVPSGT